MSQNIQSNPKHKSSFNKHLSVFRSLLPLIKAITMTSSADRDKILEDEATIFIEASESADPMFPKPHPSLPTVSIASTPATSVRIRNSPSLRDMKPHEDRLAPSMVFPPPDHPDAGEPVFPVSSGGLKPPFDDFPRLPDPVGRNKSVNSFATQKRMANGLFDIALMSSNASQLKLVIESGVNAPHFAILVTLLCVSILLQVAAAIVLLLMSKENFDKMTYEDQKARRKFYWRLNVTTTALVFCITVMNVFVASFGLPGSGKFPAAVGDLPGPTRPPGEP